LQDRLPPTLCASIKQHQQVLKVTRLFIGDGLKEPLQGITKPHVRLGLVRFHIGRDRQVPATVSNARSEGMFCI
jgi:hypothetical protein